MTKAFTHRRRFSGVLLRCDGNVVVEFALLALPIMIIVLTFFELGRYFFLTEALANAAREGARAAAVRGSASPDPATPDDVSRFVRRLAPNFVRREDVAVMTMYDPDNAPGSNVAVRVEYSYRLLVPWVASYTTVGITKSAAMTISR